MLFLLPTVKIILIEWYYQQIQNIVFYKFCETNKLFLKQNQNLTYLTLELIPIRW